MDFHDISLDELKQYYEQGKNPLAYIPYAEALRKENLLTQALEICIGGIKQDSYSVTGRTLLAKIFFDMGRYESAITELKIALKIAPDAFGPNLMLAKTLLKQRNTTDASEILHKLESQKPNDPEVRHIREEFSRFLSGVDTQVVSTKGEKKNVETKPITEQSFNIESKIGLIKTLSKSYPEIVNIEFAKLNNNVEKGQDTQDINSIHSFFLFSKKTLKEQHIGDFTKGFIETSRNFILFFEINSYLVFITTNPTTRFGRLKKDIEQLLFT